VAGLAVIAIAVATLTSLGGRPRPSHARPIPVQRWAERFAVALVTYPYENKGWNAYDDFLSRSVAGPGNSVIFRLTGLKHAPARLISSRPASVSAAIVHAGRHQAQVYALVSQVLTTSRCASSSRRGHCGGSGQARSQSSRVLLISLTMIRQGTRWLVQNGRVSVITGQHGVLSRGHP
jgi:hypothetical protein